MQLTDWLRVELALLLIGLTHISFDKNQFRFDPLGRYKSSFGLPAQAISSRTVKSKT
jgi:hypothetical protein